MEKYVVRNINRTSREITEEFAKLGTATVYEAQGKQGLMCDSIKPIQQGVSVCGPAVTALCYAGDNLMIHAAIEVCKPGDILVVSTIGDSKCGMIGDLIVQSLIKKGVKGLIIDSGIRDVSRIRELGFPVWSKYITCHGTTKVRGGWVNSPSECGGTLVNPGDLIVADDDGIVVVRQDEIQDSLNASKKREEKEKHTVEKINAGQLGVDFYGFRDVLKKQNVKYYSSKEDIKG
ncbi:4-carboxy-4-hydroxy-2-oxoadipate aldolase/oxaloacetate decarboxylase [Maledivibacter halophilus]|uniref:Putative 4-hydroxy-4-methyl-2-oxoglutarate aldolase n=1 Tax=Maledivibacter halophilus TaxID=36842 RepID=A0A1T5IBS9_9FIRM|nr:4-carboxy-4-hydroxy-2-oxoadipate aldolase/oxaloacetate decarboxylase [Maledivibacter halophilus]SKC36587.1 4-carboxy-4-hydroxy-2-oxoadipate aldolase [Maledivibacter halophilus]